MKKFFAAAILLVVALPALGQWRLSGDDQRRFDSYFARWQDSRDRNDRGEVRSMEARMLDIYARYRIPQDTPFWRVASNGRPNNWDRWRGRLSSEDQSRFDSYFSRWQGYRRNNDRGEMQSMERRMQDIYAQYRIPSDVPYYVVASNGRDDERRWDNDRGNDDRRDNDRRDNDRWNRDSWRGRLSSDDQVRFDSYYSRWLSYKRSHNGSEVASMERRMFDIMEQYSIPKNVPFEQIASR